jgi:hypothetical protein
MLSNGFEFLLIIFLAILGFLTPYSESSQSFQRKLERLVENHTKLINQVNHNTEQIELFEQMLAKLIKPKSAKGI